MPSMLEAPAAAVRLRRLWLGEVVGSHELSASDLQDAGLDVTLRRVGSVLVVATPYDFGTGDPFAGSLGDWLRTRAEHVTRGVITDVTWEFDPKRKPMRRARTSDLDIYAPGDPLIEDYPEILRKLRARVPATSPSASAAIGRLRLVGASEHRLWFAASSAIARDALGTVPGARAALVTAIQALQKNDLPLYRVVVDASYRGKKALIHVPPSPSEIDLSPRSTDS